MNLTVSNHKAMLLLLIASLKIKVNKWSMQENVKLNQINLSGFRIGLGQHT